MNKANAGFKMNDLSHGNPRSFHQLIRGKGANPEYMAQLEKELQDEGVKGLSTQEMKAGLEKARIVAVKGKKKFNLLHCLNPLALIANVFSIH